jgi:hypothetical protein
LVSSISDISQICASVLSINDISQILASVSSISDIRETRKTMSSINTTNPHNISIKLIFNTNTWLDITKFNAFLLSLFPISKSILLKRTMFT